MVGRDRELARVMLLLDDALAGGGRLVLCTGEAGIGKTRLAEEAAASAAARGVPVAWARAADRDSLPPYGWWRLSPPSGPPMMTHPVRACGRVSSVTPNARRWLMAPIPAATSGSRCSRRFAGGWRR